jgi:hypothetical protein
MQVYAATLHDAGLSLANLALKPPAGDTFAGWYSNTTKLSDTTDLSTLLDSGPTSATITAHYASSELYAYPSGAATSPTSCPAVTAAGDGCNLAQALSLAASGDTVLLAADPGSGSTATFTTASGWSLVTNGVTIRPDTGVIATLDGQGTAEAVLTYTGTGTLTVHELTVKGSVGSSDTSSPGGGLVNASTGTLVVTDSTFTGNDTSNGYGGGILNWQSGTVTVSGSTFTGNNTSGTGEAAGILTIANGTLRVTTSTFAGNLTSAPLGGGIVIGGAGTVSVVGSTFVNTPNQTAPGIYAFGAAPVLAGDLFVGSYLGCVGAVSDAGYNIDSATSCHFSAPGSVSNKGGLFTTLNPLGNYGGPTRTIPPEPGSSAVGMIPTDTTATVAGASVTLCPTTDQRGIASTGACNAGSVQGTEMTPPGSPTGLTATAGITSASLSWTAPANTGGSPITGYYVYQGATSGGESEVPVNAAPIAGTSYTVTGLTAATDYYFTVEAVTDVGSSAASKQASVTTNPRVTTAITSSATNATWPAAVTNTATLTGAGPDATGTVTFTLFSDSQCTNDVGSSTVLLTSASYDADAGWTIDSGKVTAPLAGYDNWTVAYSGDDSDASVTEPCGASMSTISPITSAAATNATLPDDTVTITATVSGLGPDETGSVVVQLFKDSGCTLHASDATSVDLSTGTYDSAATSWTFAPVSATDLAAGTYYWQVIYNSDGDNPGAVGACGGTSGESIVYPAPTASLTVTQQWIVNGTSYSNGDQPAGLAAELTLDSTDTDWGAPVVETMPATVAIDETTRFDPAMIGCTVDSQQITEIDGQPADQDITTAYSLNLVAGANTVTVTNTVTCATTLTLTDTAVGSADPQDWTLTAYSAPVVDPSTGTAVFAGPTGTLAATGDIAADATYQLGEAIDPTHTDANGADPANYVQDDTRDLAQRTSSPLATGSWTCTALDGGGNPLADNIFSAGVDGLVVVPLGYHASCAATNRTAQATLLSVVTNDNGGTLTPSAWDVSVEPNDTSGGLTGKTVAGSDSIVAADTVEVHPDAAYTVSARSADGSTNAYLLTSVQRYTGPGADDVAAITAAELADPANWTDVADAAEVAAPGAGGHAVLRVVNDDIAPLTLPHTGGIGTLAYLGAGALLAILAALGVAVITLRGRRLG